MFYGAGISMVCKLRQGHIFVALLLLLFIGGCGGKAFDHTGSRLAVPKERQLAHIGYSIQVGAFANLNNAVQLYEFLENQDVNAYYFHHATGFYKVRFGNFASKEIAREKAEHLRAAGIIGEYYIVSPDDYAALKTINSGRRYLRDEIVKTAEKFIGLPYRWGGSSSDYGFDCSGLSMTAYYLNGLNLPRSSKEQYRAGAPVNRNQLQKGDLVFSPFLKAERSLM
ncbi:MAG: C40 family peptidase [Deltaproteobacteria bacterium]|nr:C40 family peptidase [Deltaproteobacteria bacterium]